MARLPRFLRHLRQSGGGGSQQQVLYSVPAAALWGAEKGGQMHIQRSVSTPKHGMEPTLCTLLKSSRFWGGSLVCCPGHLGTAACAQMDSAR